MTGFEALLGSALAAILGYTLGTLANLDRPKKKESQ